MRGCGPLGSSDPLGRFLLLPEEFSAAALAALLTDDSVFFPPLREELLAAAGAALLSDAFVCWCESARAGAGRPAAADADFGKESDLWGIGGGAEAEPKS